MPSQPPIPPLLSPLLPALPKAGSLTVLTSVLSTSANWLVLRFIYAALREKGGIDELDDGQTGEVRILVVSWLRGLEFWRDGGRKLAIDFSRGGKLSFIDGLGGELGKGAREAEKAILTAVERNKEKGDERVLVILDGIDFVAAGMGFEVGEVMDMVGEIRERAYATIITASADSSLMQVRNTPLEVNHGALVMGLVHQATVVCAVRSLETGAARDISGVLRICRGPGRGVEDVEETEVLYFVEADGGVKVFET